MNRITTTLAPINGNTFLWTTVPKIGPSTFCKELAEQDDRISYLSFSRNFGKESAVYAGLCNARGDYVVVMDADLQHPPAMLKDMIAVMEEGVYDSAAARRVSRKNEPPIRSFFARMFYKIINKISDADIVDGACDFRMMGRDMVQNIVKRGNKTPFFQKIWGGGGCSLLGPPPNERGGWGGSHCGNGEKKPFLKKNFWVGLFAYGWLST